MIIKIKGILCHGFHKKARIETKNGPLFAGFLPYGFRGARMVFTSASQWSSFPVGAVFMEALGAYCSPIDSEIAVKHHYLFSTEVAPFHIQNQPSEQESNIAFLQGGIYVTPKNLSGEPTIVLWSPCLALESFLDV